MSYDLKNKDVAKLRLETNPSYYDGYTKAIVAKRNDINSRYLHVDIYASGKEVDITKFSPSMNIKTPTGKCFSVNGQTDNGELYFKIYDSLLKDVGHLDCDISLYKDCTNVSVDTDGSIYYGDIKLNQSKFINQVENIGTYIFEYDGTDWKLEDNVVTIADYGIEIAASINPIEQDKIIVSYSNYMLLTTETFFIAIQDNIYDKDAQIPTDEEGKVFDYIDAEDVLVTVEQSHIHDNKEILDTTTASYTTEDKTKLRNINTDLYIEKSTMGTANGVATLDNSGLVPAGQLPSFVDDVIESYVVGTTELASNWLSLTKNGSPLTPEKGKIYVIISDGTHKNKQYRWGGSTYVLCNPSDVNSVNGKTGVVNLSLDDIPNGSSNVHTSNDFTNEYKNKLENIEEGAQVNVTPDWNASKNESGYIANKPIIPEGSQLYNSTGENTDGSMTQKATTEAIQNYPATVFAETERQKSKNLLCFKDNYTVNSDGVTVTINKDTQIVTFNGTSHSGSDYFAGIRNIIPCIKNANGETFTFKGFDVISGSKSEGQLIGFLGSLDVDFWNNRYANNSTGATFTIDDNSTYDTMAFYIDSDVTLDNYQIKLQIEEGSTATEWQYPYGQITHTNDKEIAFAREEYNKSKNLWDSKNIINHPSYTSVTYSEATDTYTYTSETITNTSFTILPYNDHKNTYGFLPAGNYTLSFKTTNVNDILAPIIVAKLTNYGTFDTSIATVYITTDGYYKLSFSLSETSRIGIAWYYNAEWTGNTTPAGTKTLSNVQLEKGAAATDYQPYNGEIVHTSDFTKNGLIVSGRIYGVGSDEGILIKRASNNWADLTLGESSGIRSAFCLDPDNNALWRYSDGSSSFDILHPKKSGTIALTGDLNSYLPLSGGSLTGALKIAGNDVLYSDPNTPMAISYGRLQCYGTLRLNANTDNSTADEYVLLTSGYGCTGNKGLGLAVGQNYITWKSHPVEFTQTGLIDASALDENTWYPVLFNAPTKGKTMTIEIYVALNSNKPSWATHDAGFSVRKKWEITGGGWGAQAIIRNIYISTFSFANTDPVQGIGQLGNSSKEYVYVRGGGQYYYNISSASYLSEVTFVTDSYTINDQTISTKTSEPGYIKTTMSLNYLAANEINLLV